MPTAFATQRVDDDWEVLFNPFGWRTLLAVFSPLLFAALLTIIALVVVNPSIGLIIASQLYEDGLWKFAIFSGLAMLGVGGVVFLPISDRWWYVWRPNRYIDTFEDPGSIRAQGARIRGT